MPDLIRFSDLKTSHPQTLDGANDLIALAHPNQSSETGYSSMTTTPDQLSSYAVLDATYVNLKTTNKTVKNAINETISNFANDYSNESTYAVGDCVLYAGGLYQCNTVIAVAEEWTPAHWTAIKAVDVGSGGGGSSTLAGLTDVDISSPSNNQILKYNSTSGKWENAPGGGGGASAMSDLTDVDLTDLADGDSLVYDDTDDEWKAQAITKEVTQAQYDALVQAGTVDPKTAYFITDTNGDGQDFQPIIYSFEEREIGVWTDGKPLYECAFYSTTKYGNSDTALVLNSQIPSNIDVIDVQTELNIEATDGGNVYKFASTSAGWFSVYYDVTNNTVYAKQTLSNVSNVSSCITYVILRYTKQADTAGSGTWTPQGVPAHHYSTDEKVVGTWIDGKTLYEVTKSFQYDTSWGGTRAQISHGILNIDTPVDINCRFYSRESGALFKTVIRAENDVYTSDRDYYQSSLELNAQAFTSTNFVVAFGDNYYDNNINIDMVVTFRYTKSSS